MQPRFTLRLDEDRKNAGWGEHYWIVDGQTSALLALLPKAEAEAEVKRLNEAHQDQGLLNATIASH
jgi:hypothetical protein